MSGATPPASMGLLIIGSEILDGRRQDSHFAFCRDLLKSRGIPLRYSFVLPDVPDLIEEKLRWAMSRPEPFFCCGGIGATPDDYTRDCAARAGGVGLAVHPDGLAILIEKFGATPAAARLKLVEFPAGAALIPNSFNKVPGFTFRNGHFVPGFPEMARPMMQWVLETLYGRGPDTLRFTLLLRGAREGDLIPLMEQFTARYPALAFSSLPRFVTGGTELELSLCGAPDEARAGFDTLSRLLTEAGFAFDVVPSR